MLATSNLLLKKGSRSLLASTSLGRQAFYATSTRCSKAVLEVEHGRGQWKTYGDVDNYKPGRYQIKTFNKLSPIGLARFPPEEYDIREGDAAANAHAIMLRSHKLDEKDVPHTVRAIARYVMS